jgi:hypothetical protein
MDQRIASVRAFAVDQVVTPKGLVSDLSIHRYGSRKDRFKKNKVGKPTTDLNEKTAALVAKWEEEKLPFMEEAAAEKCDTAHVMIERNSKGDIVGWRAFQPHAHVLVTMRRMHAHGFDKNKDRTLDAVWWLKTMRAKWADYANRALEEANRAERIDHRTLEAQAADHKPQPGYHVAAPHIEVPTGYIRQQLDRAKKVDIQNKCIRFARATARSALGSRNVRDRGAQIAGASMQETQPWAIAAETAQAAQHRTVTIGHGAGPVKRDIWGNDID